MTDIQAEAAAGRGPAPPHGRLIELDGLPPFTMHTHSGPDRYISADILARGVWEPLETELIRLLLPHYALFIDVGANIGWYSVVAGLSLRGRGVVHAFEPDPANFALLETNIRAAGLVDDVRAHRAAVAERTRTGALMRDAENMGDHRLDADLADRGAGVPVAVVSLDSLFPSTPPFLLKADTQGSEPAVLAGMAAMLGAAPSFSLVLEFWPHGMLSSGQSVASLLAAIDRPSHGIFVLDEEAHGLWPITAAALADVAEGDLAPATQAFRNLAVLPLAVASSPGVQRLRLA